MSPETLIGMELGNSVIKRLLGQGTMAAVYLASQAGRKVAVKVFLPASALEQSDHEEFLKRLEEIIARNALLDHPHILPTLSHGRQANLVYQIMPVVAGENLQALLARAGALPLAQAQLYLEQLAAALDYAHVHGVLHRDVKAANILLPLEGGLLLTDFGLGSLTIEQNFAHARRAMPGMLDAIAPEYVLGRPGDQRADLYSLGAVLYQMVTGLPPFQGNSLGEVAMQHVKATPPSPRSLRPDLPQAVEQVILRALAKDPSDRYAHAHELASGFRLALETAQPAQAQPYESKKTSALNILADLAAKTSTTTVTRLSTPRAGGLFDPKWRTFGSLPAMEEPLSSKQSADRATAQPGVLDQAGQQPGVSGSLQLAAASDTDAFQFAPQPEVNPTGLPDAFAVLPGGSSGSSGSSGETTGTITRTESVKIVQVPIAGQPGHFVTGLLPSLPEEAKAGREKHRTWLKVAGLLLVLLLIATGSGAFLLIHNQRGTAATPDAGNTPNLAASRQAQATATANANIIISDTLAQNTNNWPVGQQGWFSCSFANGAYDITNNSQTRSASAFLPKVISTPFAYSLTMEQLKGDTTSPNNQFGMILDMTIQNTKGTQIIKFYALEVLNKAGGEYQFWKYDNSKNSGSFWSRLWHKGFGKEFHEGSGPSHINILKVVAIGNTFTFIVNGDQVGTLKDSSFSSGYMGMLVNLNGAEIAFSNFLLTRS